MGTENGFLEARHQEQRHAPMPIRPQCEQRSHAIRAMEEGGDEEMEMPARRRRRVSSDQKRNGASASAEMEELRRGLGMDDENGEDNTLNQGEAMGESVECEVCSDGEERGHSVAIEGEEGRTSVGI